MELIQESQSGATRQFSTLNGEREDDIQDSDAEEQEIQAETRRPSLQTGNKQAKAQRRYILGDLQENNLFTLRDVHTNTIVAAVNSPQQFLDSVGTRPKGWSDGILNVLLDYKELQAQNRLLRLKVDKHKARSNESEARTREALADQRRLRQLRDRYRMQAKELGQQNQTLHEEVRSLFEQVEQANDLSQLLHDSTPSLSKQAEPVQVMQEAQDSDDRQNSHQRLSESHSHRPTPTTTPSSSSLGLEQDARKPIVSMDQLRSLGRTQLKMMDESRGLSSKDPVDSKEIFDNFLARFISTTFPLKKTSDDKKISRLQQCITSRLRSKVDYSTTYSSFAQMVSRCCQCFSDIHQVEELSGRGRQRSRERGSDGENSKGCLTGYSPSLNRQQAGRSRESSKGSSSDSYTRSGQATHRKDSISTRASLDPSAFPNLSVDLGDYSTTELPSAYDTSHTWTSYR
ncbi:hypothetical protein MMC14_008223 [Varicellaria rhodocarpa]|nr:hypothetical protein [Varicellaria rhodocarpa]